mmetsp:Transcript_12935/g.28576  ORF Transcript_12935/g.28576 Transcript_12935/m.28576 type:complete len:94 (-) Transcript_12935:89-370(-)
MKTIKKLATIEENRELFEKNSSLIIALKWTIEKTAKIVTIADTITELLAASPDDMIGTFLDVMEGDKSAKVSDEDLAAVASATLECLLLDKEK